jgi:hypothetical protein
MSNMHIQNHLGINKLLEISSKPLIVNLDEAQGMQTLIEVGHRNELLRLLRVKNGFYAFESALHVFPLVMDDWFNSQDLARWNAPTLWKHAFGKKAETLFAFAEDIFGYQFCSQGDQIVRFDPETGDVERVCSSVDEWAMLICHDYNFQTGYPVAKAWQAKHGPIAQGNRLVPIYPLISKEGSYDVSNFYEVDDLKGMLSRANFARQVRDVKDGQQVKITPINVPSRPFK